GAGLAGVLAGLVATGEPVLVVCADARRRREHLAERLGGFTLCSWRGLECAPDLADTYTHLVALDPPAHPAQRALLRRGDPATMAHEAWGEPELGFSVHVHDEQHALRDQLTAAYRLLRDTPGELPAALPASAVAAARVLAVLDELGLVSLDRSTLTLSVPPFGGRTELERSPTFAACSRRQEEAFTWLRPAQPQAA
ncbi:MAG: hypothetical protein H0V81_06610, partial [Solirubrobacterales bacterium]|nr:hypothetical protein [Solirubrobacterales bacterium]